MKKLISLLLVLLLACCASAEINVTALNGPTGMGLCKLMSDEEGKDTYTFSLAASADLVTPGLIRGGIDKRVLASTPDEIDRMLERIMPFMRKTGGYIPTCDHGVPEEVSFENYAHFRKRLNEYCG